jgi:hypothetical protein
LQFVSVVVASGSCDRSFQRAIAPNTFLREVPLTVFVSSSAWLLWQMLIYLVRIPRRKGHSIQSIVLVG